MTRAQKAAAVVTLIAAGLVLAGYAKFDQWAHIAAQALSVFQ